MGTRAAKQEHVAARRRHRLFRIRIVSLLLVVSDLSAERSRPFGARRGLDDQRGANRRRSGLCIGRLLERLACEADRRKTLDAALPWERRSWLRGTGSARQHT